MFSGEMLKVAWFSPLSDGPNESISAYVSETLVPLLESRIKIDLYSDKAREWKGRPVYNYLTAYQRHREMPYDLFFYQLEDRKDAYFARAHLGLVPGIVYFHHFTLSDHGPEPLLNSPWKEVVGVFGSDERKWFDRSGIHDQSGPQAFRESALSLVKIFSSERDHIEYRRLSDIGLSIGESERSYFLPLPVTLEPQTDRQQESKELRIGFCGTPRLEDRSHKLLAALKRIEEPVRLFWVVSSDESGAAREAAKDFGFENIEFIEGRSPHLWRSVVSLVDIAFHTSFSVFGQLGPYLPISLACGVPSVVTNFAGGATLPDSIVFKAPPGSSEELTYIEIIRSLWRDEHKLPELGERVRTFAVETHKAEAVADELMLLFNETLPHIRRCSKKWQDLLDSAAQSIRSEALKGPDLHGVLARDIVERGFKDLGWSK